MKLEEILRKQTDFEMPGEKARHFAINPRFVVVFSDRFVLSSIYRQFKKYEFVGFVDKEYKSLLLVRTKDLKQIKNQKYTNAQLTNALEDDYKEIDFWKVLMEETYNGIYDISFSYKYYTQTETGFGLGVFTIIIDAIIFLIKYFNLFNELLIFSGSGDDERKGLFNKRERVYLKIIKRLPGDFYAYWANIGYYDDGQIVFSQDKNKLEKFLDSEAMEHHRVI